jgi:nucleoside-diphosphate-sugar epimerase
MRYAVTGGTGFVGGVLVRQLREAGHEVVALMRGSPGSKLGVETVRGDLLDVAALERLCSGVDGLFHVAGWYKVGTRDAAEGTRVNVDGTRNVLSAAIRSGVPRVVYTSTLAVNSDTRGRVVDESYRFRGRHISAYDESKARAHDVALEFAAEGLPVVVVMPGLVYGPSDTALTGHLIRDTVRGRRTAVPAGGGVCWGYVDDVAAGHVLAMQRGAAGETYMLAGPPASLAEGLRRVAGLAGTRPPMVLPNALVRATAATAGLVGRVIPLPPMYAAESLRAGLATYFGNPAKARAELGWTVRDLDQGLRDTFRAESWPTA